MTEQRARELLAAEFHVPWVVKAILAGDDNAAPRIGLLAALRAITTALAESAKSPSDSVREALTGCEAMQSGPNGRGGMRVVAHFAKPGDEVPLFDILSAALQSSEADNG